MIEKVYLGVVLSTCIIITNLPDSTQAFSIFSLFQKPNTNIFKSPGDTDVSDISNGIAPWVKDEYIPTLQAFLQNVTEDTDASETIQKFKDFKSDSKTSRKIIFNLLNTFLASIGHPVPPSVANDVSKIGSLFDPITLPILIEADAVHLAEFLLIHNVEVDRKASKRYADALSNALGKADPDSLESIWQALLDAYADFVMSYKFKIGDVIDELLDGLTSYLLVILERQQQ